VGSQAFWLTCRYLETYPSSRQQIFGAW